MAGSSTYPVCGTNFNDSTSSDLLDSHLERRKSLAARIGLPELVLQDFQSAKRMRHAFPFGDTVLHFEQFAEKPHCDVAYFFDSIWKLSRFDLDEASV